VDRGAASCLQTAGVSAQFCVEIHVCVLRNYGLGSWIDQAVMIGIQDPVTQHVYIAVRGTAGGF
jgi:hypothetical protein